MNSIWVLAFHFLPPNCSFNNFISGIILLGVQGDVVKNSALLSILAINITPLIVFNNNVHFIIIKSISNIYRVIFIIFIKYKITI